MVTEELVVSMAERGVKYLLAWNFKTEENTIEAIRRYKAEVPSAEQSVVAAITSKTFEGYSILVCKSIPDFNTTLPALGFHPVKKDRANWVPRFDQDGRNKGRYEVADNLNWMPVDQVLEFIRKDQQLELLYK